MMAGQKGNTEQLLQKNVSEATAVFKQDVPTRGWR